MKRFIIIVASIVFLLIIFNLLYFHLGVYIDFHPNDPITISSRIEGQKFLLNNGDDFSEISIKGVNMGSGIPGKWSTEFAVKYSDYLRWFSYIKEMGANTIRVYTVNDDTFYNALYDFNTARKDDPLYLIHGVWVNDYLCNSHRDAYHPDILDAFLRDCKIMVDVLHGNRKIRTGKIAYAGSGNYRKDVSPWVIGYILGVEWEDRMVAHTNEKHKDSEHYNQFSGKYLYTSEDATPFEAFLARVGEEVIAYETSRYKIQRPIAFSNWPTTDPFEYPEYINIYFNKCATVDTETIKSKDSYQPGLFASYHVYPYYRKYFWFVTDFSELDFVPDPTPYYEDGYLNTYRLYLQALVDHHEMPVIISEFGLPSGRGVAHVEPGIGRNQGFMSETQQGEALVKCYEDIMDTGCIGALVFSWQDEWFKRTWNTFYTINAQRTAYWSDYQTNEQHFGLLCFDPGNNKCISYIDGDVSEWTDEDIVTENDDLTLSMKYDEKFIYFCVKSDEIIPEDKKIFIPLDITPKTGSNYCENYSIQFDKAVDFLLVIDGKEDSQLLVQERYEPLRSTHSGCFYLFDTYVSGNIPDKDSPKFMLVQLPLELSRLENEQLVVKGETFPTGKLTYGNANPNSEEYNSLADFIYSKKHIEIKLPWQILNFADPSRMEVHDDYYDNNYGIEKLFINKLSVGIASEDYQGRIPLNDLPLKQWGKKVKYHERLKPSYYILKELWTKN